MRLRPNGQVTLPIEVREHLGLHEGDEIEFVIEGDTVHLIAAKNAHGSRVAARLRGRGSSGMSTADIMTSLRGED